MTRLRLTIALTLALAAPASAMPLQEPAPVAEPEPAPVTEPAPEAGQEPAIAYRNSTPVGVWWAGKLRRGVQLPAEGTDWFTWDPIRKGTPNRGWRRWGTDRLVRKLIGVVEEHRLEHALAPRVGIGDLSRPRGGDFGPRFGGLGHASHQNGLDADVYYPRHDGLERRPHKPSQVDRELAQDLVDRFLAAGARVIYVGPSLDLKGPRDRVVPLVHHDDHLHVRFNP